MFILGYHDRKFNSLNHMVPLYPQYTNLYDTHCTIAVHTCIILYVNNFKKKKCLYAKST